MHCAEVRVEVVVALQVGNRVAGWIVGSGNGQI